MRDLQAEFRVNCKHTSANKACLREDQTHSALKNHTGALQTCCSRFLKVSSSQRLWINSPKKSDCWFSKLRTSLWVQRKECATIGEQNPDGCIYTTLHLSKSPQPLPTSVVSSCREDISTPLQSSPPPMCQVKGHRDAQRHVLGTSPFSLMSILR